MFEKAAKHLNFRSAAEELNLTQGAVAQQVRNLESALGIKLFHRQARGLALTHSGRRYYESISKGLEIIEQATKNLVHNDHKITISAPPSLASKWLVFSLSKFSNNYPDIEIDTIASEKISQFTDDEVDMAIRQGSPPFSQDLHYQLLSPLNICAVTSPGYAKQINKITEFKEFTAYQLIQDLHKLWEVYFQREKLELNKRIVSFNQTALAMDAAASGQGIALVPELLLIPALSSGTLVKLWQDQCQDNNGYYIIHKKNQTAKQRIINNLSDFLINEVNTQ